MSQSSIILYTKPGCHLCEEAEALLLQAGVAWQSIDITADPSLFEQYRYRIPVVAVNGREVLAAPITRADVLRLFGDSIGSSR